MKFMGSKRGMLQNGLGQLLDNKVVKAKRFIDLFTGSGAVASFVSQRLAVPVVAFDLQLFCVTLAQSVIERVAPLDSTPIWSAWNLRAEKVLKDSRRLRSATRPLPHSSKFTQSFVSDMREACASVKNFPITRAYSGYYFSQAQGLWLDGLRRTLPVNEEERTVALAALIQAASGCAASPGHTAQPLQPTRSAKKFIYEAWSRDIVLKTKINFESLCKQHALCKGRGVVRDANNAIEEINENDLVFIDPPYTAVHYSRFYHVLETIAHGECNDVSGAGRYPPWDERPWSRYSVPSKSRTAISELLEKIAEKGATAIVTFPDKLCSNGISSYLLRKLGREYFERVGERVVRGKFSTLGGTSDCSRNKEARRAARQHANELMLLLESK